MEMNILWKEITIEKVRRTMFGIGPLNAVGSDGLHTLFYQNYFHVFFEECFQVVVEHVRI